ncbi:MAG: hypothetical protein K2L02_06030, partial [Clostridia bacterium]|nr:hypothetical protein [Clostridia bacterium]
MDILQTVLNFVSKAPEWACLYVVPAVIAVAAVGFAFTSKRKWFFMVAAFVGAAGFLLAYAKDATLSFVYLVALVALSSLLSLLFLFPAPDKRKKRQKIREEKIFDKFREELAERPYKPTRKPPKVCCFERDKADGVTAKDYGVSLSYADALLKKLRVKKMNAGDRLETEELLRRLDCYREKPLDEGERSSL